MGYRDKLEETVTEGSRKQLSSTMALYAVRFVTERTVNIEKKRAAIHVRPDWVTKMSWVLDETEALTWLHTTMGQVVLDRRRAEQESSHLSADLITRSPRSMLLTESSGAAAQESGQNMKSGGTDIVQRTKRINPRRSCPRVFPDATGPPDGDIVHWGPDKRESG